LKLLLGGTIGHFEVLLMQLLLAAGRFRLQSEHDDARDQVGIMLSEQSEHHFHFLPIRGLEIRGETQEIPQAKCLLCLDREVVLTIESEIVIS
jgi:hypothetical protein